MVLKYGLVYFLCRCTQRIYAKKMLEDGELFFNYPKNWIAEANKGNDGQGDKPRPDVPGYADQLPQSAEASPRHHWTGYIEVSIRERVSRECEDSGSGFFAEQSGRAERMKQELGMVFPWDG
jgi:hypothetical protein